MYNPENIEELQKLLPTRTLKSIKHVASHLGLRFQPKTSQYYGIHWHKKMKKWQCLLVIRSQRVLIGYFDTEDEARQARDKYMEENSIRYRGKYKNGNDKDSSEKD
jgi:hypothetical protein